MKGKTKSGIKYTIDERVKDDARFLYYLAKMQNKTEDEMSRVNAVMDMMKLIFGSDEGVIQFMNAVAECHEGVCDMGTMITELTEMFDGMNAKNSSSSRKSSTSARTS